jgi:SAM-dependent methyltransferase
MWIPQLPRALWWSHNAYYHRWMLRHLPPTVGWALDVGCGRGDLAMAMAGRAQHVDAVDASEAMIEVARRRAVIAGAGAVNWVAGDILDGTLPLRSNGYDVVTAVASLHHMPLYPGLRRLAELVRPGGLLVIVGLYRSATAVDYGVDAVAVQVNALVGAVLAAQGRAGKPGEADMPVRDPVDSLAAIRSAAAEITPGAVVTRRLYFRYSLLWRRPGR